MKTTPVKNILGVLCLKDLSLSFNNIINKLRFSVNNKDLNKQ